MNKLGSKRTQTLFSETELAREPDQMAKVILLAGKLDTLAACLKLSVYDDEGTYKGKLLSISHSKIEPAYFICPTSFMCETQDCIPRSLLQSKKIMTYQWLL
jgi:hypothetical protein